MDSAGRTGRFVSNPTNMQTATIMRYRRWFQDADADE